MTALVQFKESSYQSYPKKLIIIKISTTKIRLHSTYSKLIRVLTLHLNTPHLYLYISKVSSLIIYITIAIFAKFSHLLVFGVH